jgi:hypothetical protein
MDDGNTSYSESASNRCLIERWLVEAEVSQERWKEDIDQIGNNEYNIQEVESDVHFPQRKCDGCPVFRDL